MKEYQINVFYSEEDDGWIADIPDLDFCSAFGASPEEALREVLVAKRLWIESCLAEGRPVPAPRFRPVIYQAAS